MTTIVLVHGTGVRSGQYDALMERVEANLAKQLVKPQLLPCSWGETHGARLNAGGASLPEQPAAAEDTDAGEADGILQWAALEADPFIELRSLGRETQPVTWAPLQQRAVEVVLGDVRSLDDPALDALLVEHGLSSCDLDMGKSEVADALRTYLWETTLDRTALRRAAARALVACTLSHPDERWDGVGAGVDGATVDELVIAVLTAWGEPAASLGWISGLTKPVWLPLLRVSEWSASWRMRSQRFEKTEKNTPLIGDILRYQARGEGLRQAVADVIEAAPEPVVILAHSLGGVACVDLLATVDYRDKVAALVTVGSQAPFFYELDALWSLPFGEPLPSFFPDRWFNAYDPRDPLAYVAEGVFGSDRVSDKEFNTRRPLIRAHSAYWDHKPFYVWLTGTVLQ